MKSTAPTPASLAIARLFHTVKITDFKILLACLSIGFIIRLVPELLAFPLPIGFDTIYYASVMKTGVVWAHWSTFFTTTWLLNALIVPLYSISQIDPFVLLKFVAPLLYGLNVAGIYSFARKTLNWNIRMSVLAGVFFALQLASLRISWDLLKNTLGLGVLLFALSQVKEVKSKTGFLLFASLSTLSVFAHEYATVTLFVSVIGLVVWQEIKKKVNLPLKRLLLGVLPALGVFSMSIYFRFSPIPYGTGTNIISAADSIKAHPGVFFLVDYLQVHSSVDYYASYSALASNVFLLFAVLYVPFIFLVVKGFFKNGFLNFWTGLLLIGAFGCLIFPFFALEFWHRWMFMLAYPFTFYAVNGLNKLLTKSREKKPNSSSWLVNKKVAGMILLTFSLGIAYLATPITMAYGNASVPSFSGTYLYFSTNPTVPYEDVNSVIQAMIWLDSSMDSTSCVILQRAYQSWGQLYMDSSHAIVTFETDANLALNTAIARGFARIYFVWWNVPTDWYNVTIPTSFNTIKAFGRISVYEYGGISIVGS